MGISPSTVNTDTRTTPTSTPTPLFSPTLTPTPTEQNLLEEIADLTSLLEDEALQKVDTERRSRQHVDNLSRGHTGSDGGGSMSSSELRRYGKKLEEVVRSREHAADVAERLSIVPGDDRGGGRQRKGWSKLNGSRCAIVTGDSNSTADGGVHHTTRRAGGARCLSPSSPSCAREDPARLNLLRGRDFTGTSAGRRIKSPSMNLDSCTVTDDSSSRSRSRTHGYNFTGDKDSTRSAAGDRGRGWEGGQNVEKEQGLLGLDGGRGKITTNLRVAVRLSRAGEIRNDEKFLC